MASWRGRQQYMTPQAARTIPFGTSETRMSRVRVRRTAPESVRAMAAKPASKGAKNQHRCEYRIRMKIQGGWVETRMCCCDRHCKLLWIGTPGCGRDRRVAAWR